MAEAPPRLLRRRLQLLLVALVRETHGGRVEGQHGGLRALVALAGAAPLAHALVLGVPLALCAFGAGVVSRA